jgi:hypothetical protein
VPIGLEAAAPGKPPGSPGLAGPKPQGHAPQVDRKRLLSSRVMMYDVFLSHAPRDRAVAARLAGAFSERGWRCWLAPRDPPREGLNPVMLTAALTRSRMLLLVASYSVAEAPGLKQLLEQAYRNGIPILVFRIENVRLRHVLSDRVPEDCQLSALKRPLAPYIEQLMAVAAGILDPGDTGGPGGEGGEPMGVGQGPSTVASSGSHTSVVLEAPPVSRADPGPQRQPALVTGIPGPEVANTGPAQRASRARLPGRLGWLGASLLAAAGLAGLWLWIAVSGARGG